MRTMPETERIQKLRAEIERLRMIAHESTSDDTARAELLKLADDMQEHVEMLERWMTATAPAGRAKL